MKICQIGTGAQSIGNDSTTAVELVINNLSTQLAELGNDVHIVDIVDPLRKRNESIAYHFIKLPSFLKSNYKPGGIMHIIKKLIFSVKTVFLLSKINKKEKFDVVHIQNQYPGFFVLIAKNLINARFVYTSHTPFWTLPKKDFFKQYYIKTYMERACMRLVDKVVAVGYAQKEGIIEKAGISSEKINVIQNGVDLLKFHPGKSALEKQFKNNKAIIVLSVARISRVKNQMLIVESIPEIIKAVKNIKFLFIGQPEDKEYLEQINQFANKKDINKYIKIIGPINNNLLSEYYRLADIYISASSSEGLPLSVLESMASGCAVLISDIKPHAEISKNKEIIYFAPGDHNDLIKKLKYVIKNKPYFLRLRRKSLKTAQEFYSWKRVASEYLVVYRDII